MKKMIMLTTCLFLAAGTNPSAWGQIAQPKSMREAPGIVKPLHSTSQIEGMPVVALSEQNPRKSSSAIPPVPRIASRENLLRKPDLDKLTQNVRSDQKGAAPSPDAAPSTEGETKEKAVPLMALEAQDPIEEGEFVTREEFEELAQREGWRKGDFRFTPYGYFSVSTIFESARTKGTDYACYVLPPESQGEPAFTVDPKSSRLGMKVEGPKFHYWPEATLTGLVEVDFQGQYVIKNKPGLLFRRGFIEIGDDYTSFKFGQDWEVIAPLVPKMLNWAAGAAVGNLGYRRGMFEIDRNVELSPTFGYEWQFGLCANLTNDFNTVSSVSPDPSGWPVFEGRIAGVFGYRDGPCAMPITLGAFGHIGEQMFDFTVGGTTYDDVPERTWSFGCDLDLPITQRLTLQGEFFTGENLSTFFGGIFQGVDLLTRESIRSTGGWAAFNYECSKRWKFNVGFLIDDPHNGDVHMTSPSGTSILYNHAYFANCLYFWNDAFFTGLEVSQWKTHWQTYDTGTGDTRRLDPGNSTRFEFVARYLF